MKSTLSRIIIDAAQLAFEQSALPSNEFPAVELEEPKAEAHGDFATNFALVSAKIQKMAPRKIATAIIERIQDPDGVLLKTEIAGPGFINLFINPTYWQPVLHRIHEQGLRYGASDLGQGERVQVEFVSANPTGPLHIGHGRGAAVGDTLAAILAFSGHEVQKEYYINDSGRQIRTLGQSVYLRLQELNGQTIEFPPDCYQGRYIIDLAREVAVELAGDLENAAEDAAIDMCARYAAKKILAGIRDDLEKFGVHHERWFSERDLYEKGLAQNALDELEQRGIIYKKDGALWFKTESYGDEKDRVVVRQNGQTTYFASDIAYHREKFERGLDRVIDVWGADHHGYVARLTAAIEAAGYRREQFQVVLVQLVNLLRAGDPVAMSTRSGEFVTLRDVVEEVGRDAARFIFLTRHYESPLDFDLELAKQKTNDNPVYYVQYVHARIASIRRKGIERDIDLSTADDAALILLSEPEEIGLIKILARYPQVIENSAKLLAPHRITYYLMSLAAAFHAYYNKHRVLTDDPDLTRARIYLATAVKVVIQNGLTLLGVSAPEKM